MTRKKLTPEERRLAAIANRKRTYYKNRDKAIAASAAWYYSNKDKRKLYDKERRKDPVILAEINRLRREARWRKMGSPSPAMTPDEKIKSKAESRIKYLEKHRERALERSKNWRINNHERYILSLRNNYKKNREEHCKKTSQWKRDNPDKVRASSAAREHRLKNSLHPYLCKKSIESIYGESVKLYRETGVPHEVDHIIPTRHNGFHHQDNLQCIPAILNASKQDDPFWISPVQYRDWRDVPRFLWPKELVSLYIDLIEKNKGTSIRWDAAA